MRRIAPTISTQPFTMVAENLSMRILPFLFLVGLAACPTKHNPDVCCTTEADCMAQGLPPGSACAQGLVCRGNQCIAETCASSAECDAAAPFCINQSCVEMCNDDSQCPGFGGSADDKFCVAGAC